MSGNQFWPIDFGDRVPGLSGLDATGSSGSKPFLLSRKISVFTTVPSGSVAGLPSSYAAGTTLSVLNRGSYALAVQPPAKDQIENYGTGVALAVEPGGNANFTSFDPPASPSPRTWWLT